MDKPIKILEQRITALEEENKKLRASTTIPFDVDAAFRTRLGTPKSSSKVSTSENQAVDEGGSMTYSVLKAPDGFLEVSIGATIYYLPYYA